MRNLPAALALSVIAHGAVLGWWVTRHHEPPPPEPERAADPEPITVDIVPLPPPPAPKLAAAIPAPPLPPLPPSVRHAPAEPGMARISISPTPAAPTPESHTPAAPPPNGPHSPLLAMRDANPKPRLDDTGTVIESIAARPHAPESPTPPPGGARTADDIENDIKTTEHDLHDPGWVANATPEAVGEARDRLVALYGERDGHELQRDPHGGGYTARHGGYTVHVDPDGTTHITDTPGWQQHGLVGTFDATDALMRHYHQDPYAANKLETLDRTRDERAAITKRYRREQLRHSKELVVSALGDVWKTTQDLHERKELVFELWDDCAETGDPEVIEGGHEARAAVVAFIQAHFTGADAYTPGELHALNAHKTSQEPFAPYERE